MLSLTLLALLLATAPANEDCAACHADPQAAATDGRSMHVDEARVKASVHGELLCSDCHADIQDLPHPERLARVDCGACHGEAVEQLKASVHKRPAKPGAPDRVTCGSCHGAAHDVRPRSDPASKVSKRNLPDTCGRCHADPEFMARHQVLHARPVEAYRLGIHGRAVERGDEKAAACSDCHGSHAIGGPSDAGAKINRANIPATCGSCHKAIAEAFGKSVHGRAAQRGVGGAPVCTDCHGEHRILAPSEPGSLVNPARVSSDTCGRCHGDERLSERLGLPADKVPAFDESYHGLALKSGSRTAANCASCHGVHDILPSSDPASRVHKDNLARTCGNCHPGAGSRFALGPIHVRTSGDGVHPAVHLVRGLYLWLIPLTIGAMLLHNLIDFLAKLRRNTPPMTGGAQVVRMGPHFRVAHGLVVLSFTLLVLTGFALKFPDSWWAAPLLAFEGRFALRGGLHRLAGVVLMLGMLYHVVHLLRVPQDRRILRQMLPRVSDWRELVGMLRHNLGRGPHPTFAKFNYAEKAEYWAFLWGTLVMALSGAVLWFNDLSLRHLPKWVSDVATAVHWYEAVLATLAILVWHFYFVIFDPDVYPMERAWLTGKVWAEHLRHTRPAYFRALRAAGAKGTEPAPTPADPQPASPPVVDKPGNPGDGG